MVLITIIGLSIGYSAFNTDLSISGDATIVKMLAKDKILYDNGGKEYIEGKGTPIFDGVATTDEGMYAAEDNDGTSYYYRGDIDNNWLYFAGYYWRIIRINGDGSIRMIYNGTTTNQTGEDTQIGTSAFNEQANDNAYVGYMYGTPGSDTYEETHANINDSTIKKVLDNWYQQNLLSYSNYISLEQGFCNDRSLNTTDEIWWDYDTKLGYGTNATAYAPWSRIFNTSSWLSIQKPSLECNYNNDLFTINKSSKGNHSLTYPIGLITSDEVVLAGGFGGGNNSSYYLYTNQNYWVMSSCVFSETGYAFTLFVHLNGHLNGGWVNNIYGIRPVINLNADLLLAGDGTTNNPYRIVN